MGEPRRRTPLWSTRADDPAAREPLDRFVVELGERVDALQDAELASRFDRLGSLARELRQVANELGYGPLAECAAAIVAASGERDVESTHKQLVELTDIAQRVRLGHRGAA